MVPFVPKLGTTESICGGMRLDGRLAAWLAGASALAFRQQHRYGHESILT